MTYLIARSWRRYSPVLMTLFAAFACGHFMQGGALPTAVTTADAPRDAIVGAALASPNIPSAPICARTARVEAGIAGMVRVVLSDPCSPASRVEVAQGRLAADWQLDAAGQRLVSFAPLNAETPLTVTWSDGTVTTQTIPDLPNDAPFRVALAWSGPAFLSLAEEEFGAPDAATEYLAADTKFTAWDGRERSGGFMTILGDGLGQTVQVYTFPNNASSKGVIRLAVQAPVTMQSCGRMAEGTAFQTDAFGRVMASDVKVALPECDAIGQTLVLRNLFRDLRLAAR